MSTDKLKVIYHIIKDSKITEKEFITLMEDENTTFSRPIIKWETTTTTLPEKYLVSSTDCSEDEELEEEDYLEE